jgi:hypothetical protein
MFYLEKFDCDKLAYLIQNKDNVKMQMRETCNNTSWDAFNLPEKYLYNSTGGTNKVTYKQKNNTGRYFAEGALSLQSFCREIRHTIARDYYDDIDIVNCHPVILSWFCSKNDIEAECLNEYIENRENIIQNIIKKNGKKLNRDFVKRAVLSVINGGASDYKKIKHKTNWLKNYHSEVQEIHEAIIELKANEYEKYNTDKNKIGSFVNKMLCEYENTILQEMVKFFGISNGDVCVLCFDGLMLEKNRIGEDQIRACEMHINKLLKINIQLKKKDMNEGLDIDCKDYKFNKNYFQWNIPIYETFDDYTKLLNREIKISNVLDYVNQTIYFINNGGNSYFLTKNKKIINPRTGEFNYTFNNVKIKSIKDALNRNTSIINKDDKKSTIYDIFNNYIIKENMINTYSSVTFYPYLDKQPYLANAFNLFQGFKYNSYVQNETEYKFEGGLFYNHIKYTLCNGNENVFNYLCCYIADMIQNPDVIPGVALLFMSEQGAGKDLFANFLSLLIGQEHYLSLNKPADLFERFNGSHKGKLLVKINEISDRGAMYKNHNLLKDIITRETVQIEPKGFEKIEYKHYARYIFFTNNENGLLVENSDRRYVMVKCNNDNCQRNEYFKPLFDLLYNEQHNKNAFDYFKSLDISEFNIRDIPTTMFKNKIKLEQLCSPLLFMKDAIKTYLNTGMLYDSDIEDDAKDIKIQDEIKIKSTELYSIYKMFCNEQGENAYSNRSFYKKLSDINVQKKDIKINKRTCKGIILNINAIKQAFKAHLRMDDFDF